MKLRATLPLTVVLALGVIAAGCGSSDDHSSSTSSLTKAEWIAKADAICKQGNQQIEQAAQQAFGKQKPSEAQVKQFQTDNVLPSVQSQVDQIKALGAPSGDDDEVSKLLDAVQADIDKAKSGALSQKTFADGDALARQYGLKVCGKG